jgi:hypothetical protein
LCVFQELRDLFKKYKERMESEGKKVRSGGGGFGGTGFKFDEIEAQYTTEKKKYQKAAFGLQVRVKLKIKRKERNFEEIEAQYTTEKKKYQKAAFGLQVRVKLKINRKIKAKKESLTILRPSTPQRRRSTGRRRLDSRLGLN